ncbi:hypothetical protein D3C80_1322380 [compost metagenome]
MHLRFAGACADRRPAEQVVEVAGHQRLQQFGGDRQAEAERIQHQPARQGEAGGHVAAAVELRVVDQALPADGGARLLDIGAHHQQQLVVHLRRQFGEAAGVVEGGFGVVQGTGADYHQQALVATIEDGADGLALVLYAGSQGGAQWQALAEFGRRRQRLFATTGGRQRQIEQFSGLRGADQGGNGRIHLGHPWPTRSLPRGALSGCSFRSTRCGGGCRAKSPVVAAVIGAVGVSGHVSILS